MLAPTSMYPLQLNHILIKSVSLIHWLKKVFIQVFVADIGIKRKKRRKKKTIKVEISHRPILAALSHIDFSGLDLFFQIGFWKEK